MLLPGLQQGLTWPLPGVFIRGKRGVMVTWLQTHPLDESQEILLLLELLLVCTSASLYWPLHNSGSRSDIPRDRRDSGTSRGALFWTTRS